MYCHKSLLILLAVFCGVYSVSVQQEVSLSIPTLDCSLVLCAFTNCPNPITPPGKCCPICPDCSDVPCPKPLCANPKLKPGECCSSCEDSNCKFKGCVNFLPNNGVQWAPNPCSVCQCTNNQPICAAIDCFSPTEEDCFGYPVVTRPNDCCPRCDYGVANNTCGVVLQLFGKQNMTVSATPGAHSCNKEIVKHTCDKFSFRSGGEKFRCDPVVGRRVLRFNRGCPLYRATYSDITKCKAVKDDAVIAGCDLTVD